MTPEQIATEIAESFPHIDETDRHRFAVAIASAIEAARADEHEPRVTRLEAQIKGVMNCLAQSQQEVETLRSQLSAAREETWKAAIEVARKNPQYDSSASHMWGNLVRVLEAAAKAQGVEAKEK